MATNPLCCSMKKTAFVCSPIKKSHLSAFPSPYKSLSPFADVHAFLLETEKLDCIIFHFNKLIFISVDKLPFCSPSFRPYLRASDSYRCRLTSWHAAVCGSSRGASLAWGARSQPWLGQLPGPLWTASDLVVEEEEGHSLGVVVEEEGQSLGVEEEEEGHQSLGVVVEEEEGGPFQVEVVVGAEKSPALAEVVVEEEVVAGGQQLHHLVKVEVGAEVEAHLRRWEVKVLDGCCSVSWAGTCRQSFLVI